MQPKYQSKYVQQMFSEKFLVSFSAHNTVLSRNNLTKTAVNLGQAAVKPRLNRSRNEVRPRLNLGQT